MNLIEEYVDIIFVIGNFFIRWFGSEVFLEVEVDIEEDMEGEECLIME